MIGRPAGFPRLNPVKAQAAKIKLVDEVNCGSRTLVGPTTAFSSVAAIASGSIERPLLADTVEKLRA